jgi:hypothetical protein
VIDPSIRAVLRSRYTIIADSRATFPRIRNVAKNEASDAWHAKMQNAKATAACRFPRGEKLGIRASSFSHAIAPRSSETATLL